MSKPHLVVPVGANSPLATLICTCGIAAALVGSSPGQRTTVRNRHMRRAEPGALVILDGFVWIPGEVVEPVNQHGWVMRREPSGAGISSNCSMSGQFHAPARGWAAAAEPRMSGRCGATWTSSCALLACARGPRINEKLINDDGRKVGHAPCTPSRKCCGHRLGSMRTQRWADLTTMSVLAGMHHR